MADQNSETPEVIGTTHLLNPLKSESVIQGRAVVAYMEVVTSKVILSILFVFTKNLIAI
jgi:hypothetical protein